MSETGRRANGKRRIHIDYSRNIMNEIILDLNGNCNNISIML
ncbi:hypothetical protein [Acetohalobium arabaticum]|nr:hypothetical protein [Acetohalobium arabaticum]